MTQRDKIIPGPNVVKPIKGLILPRNVAEKYIKEKKSKHWSQIKDGPVKQTLTQKEYHADKKWREQEAKTAEIKKAIEYYEQSLTLLEKLWRYDKMMVVLHNLERVSLILFDIFVILVFKIMWEVLGFFLLLF